MGLPLPISSIDSIEGGGPEQSVVVIWGEGVRSDNRSGAVFSKRREEKEKISERRWEDCFFFYLRL